MRFVPGQRWISETEPELGLGLLIHSTPRSVTIRFDACDCTRQYTLSGAPLKRVIFRKGDDIRFLDDHRLTIASVSESDGLVYYSDGRKTVCETDLVASLSFSMPQDRLFAGITDACRIFDLRRHLLRARAGYDASEVKGFLGGKVDLIAHQFYIAHTVTARHSPRVLLSDETGLGKTIEACLILHRLVITHRVRRILIIVPESLTHQWFIELYRRFNLSFMILNEAYCRHLDRRGKGVNPFLEHQFGIVSFDFLGNIGWHSRIQSAGWDMVVVDEAHHISDHKPVSDFIRHLAGTVPGLMLLTATPQQMGLKTHFFHLQLLDPHRYFDFNGYCREIEGYAEIARKVRTLLKKGEPVDTLLDSYGPGRVIFRNHRNIIKGFPCRIPRLKGLDADPSHIGRVHDEFFNPETADAPRLDQDPRIRYLLDLIRKKDKILVICASGRMAEAVEKALSGHIAVDMARFDETMTLLQRDRQAAWFARKDGARVLISSEIGSEGRNFQFVHHLFLFDLPQNPELLEQRIGRLDRIGQKNDIHIHVPYLRGSVHEILARWYMEGLNLFKRNVNGLYMIHHRFESRLNELFRKTESSGRVDEPALERLIDETRDFCRQVDQNLNKHKNLLLELNSFKPGPAGRIIEAVQSLDEDPTLADLMTRVLEHYGIETDDLDTGFFRLHFRALLDEKFPVPERLSPTLTFDRALAVQRDDVEFFSWDHPFIHRAFEYFTTSPVGTCALARLEGTGKQGLLLETVFIPECVAPLSLDMGRYLKPDPIRIVVDHEGRDLTEKFDTDRMGDHLRDVPPTRFTGLDILCRELVPGMLEKSLALAEKQSEFMVREAEGVIRDILGRETDRLRELKKINPDIRDIEIRTARTRMTDLLKHLSETRPRLDALRLIRSG